MFPVSRVKKSLALLIMTTPLWVATDACAASTSHAPVGSFAEVITFQALNNCPTPPVLELTVVRNHPKQKYSTLLPKVGSPYHKAVILASDPYDAVTIRHYTDEVHYGKVVMILKGKAEPRGGTWSDNKGCKGTFIVANG